MHAGAPSASRPARVLHVLGGLNPAGAENWLMQALRAAHRTPIRMDFVVLTTKPGVYDREAHALGAKVIPVPDHRHPVSWMRRFRHVLEEFGPYDIVHSHVHHYSGLVLQAARSLRSAARIAHSHSDTASVQMRASLPRRGYFALTRELIARNATAGFACSGHAAAALFGANWNRDPRWRVLPCGIDLRSFERVPDTIALRRELGLPSDVPVIGHVGRFVPAKNHELLLAVATELAARGSNAHFLLVGDGPVRASFERKAEAAGVRSRFVFTGVRSDVAELTTVMDVFLFPSRYEGLGLAAIEAQAAGLPTIVSDRIPRDVDVVPELVRRLSVDAAPALWANSVMEAVERTPPVTREEAIRRIEASPFGVDRSITELFRAYEEALCRH